MRWIWIGVLGWLLSSAPVRGQAPAKPMAFDAVTIKPSAGGPQRFGPTPDGYQMRNLYMIVPILTAYPPLTGGSLLYNGEQRAGFPEWVSNDAYDIDAKVSEADLADWGDPKKQPEMLRAMLQTMLTRRLKLEVHREQREGNVYELVVAKGGPRFQATDRAVHHTGQLTMPDGSVIGPERTKCLIITHYWAITMPMVASFVMNAADRPVVDRTGLTGRYDLQREIPLQGCAPGGGAPEAGPSVFTFAEGLGLKLVPAKAQVETLVIDRVERPTEN